MSAKIGFRFGRLFAETRDGGRRWRALAAPGVIDDLAVSDDRLWALAETCRDCSKQRLLSATVAHPRLRRVRDIPTLSYAVLAAGHGAVYLRSDVSSRGAQLWARLGRQWHRATNPCGRLDYSSPLAVGADRTLLLACGGQEGAGNQFGKIVYSSSDAGRTWVKRYTFRGTGGYLQGMAVSGRTVVLAQARGTTYISHDDARRWRATRIGYDGIGTVTRIGKRRFVALTYDENNGHRLYISRNAGHTWTAFRVPLRRRHP